VQNTIGSIVVILGIGFFIILIAIMTNSVVAIIAGVVLVWIILKGIK
jgi:hypothetical protein